MDWKAFWASDSNSRLRMDRGWKWLLYLDVVLPGVLYLLALPQWGGFSRLFAQFFHTWALFVMNPVPALPTLVGVPGLLLHLGMVGWCLWRRRWVDALVCLLFAGLMAAFFLVTIDGTALNYWALLPLDLGGWG